ncbi:MAG: hypothetical protein RSD39_01785 [Oscillospiraceae bacterium]
MIKNKILPENLNGKGICGLPDCPSLTTTEMQGKFEELVREVVIPKHNAVVEELDREFATKQYVGVTVQNIGAGDMAKLAYDTDGDGTVNKADNGYFEYTHSKVGTVHSLEHTGDAHGHIRFLATGDFADGDTWTVNSAVCTAQTQDGELLSGGFFKAGSVVSCFKNGSVLNFKSGGAALNFKIIRAESAAVLPVTAAENTIAVETATDITSWSFGTAQPTARADGSALVGGELWIQTSIVSECTFNALKKNEIKIYPVACRQYAGGAWVEKTAKTFQGGAWKSWSVMLFHDGLYDVSVGTMSNTPINAAKNAEMAAYGSTTAFGFKVGWSSKKIDLTNKSTVTVNLAKHTTQDSTYLTPRPFALGFTDVSGSTTAFPANPAAMVQFSGVIGTVTDKSITLDVRALVGEYFMFWGVNSFSGMTSTEIHEVKII